MRKELAVLAQADTKAKVPLSHRIGKQDWSNSYHGPVPNLKKELTAAQQELGELKNQLHQSKENNAKERAEHC
jgi:hypothetical protein